MFQIADALERGVPLRIVLVEYVSRRKWRRRARIVAAAWVTLEVADPYNSGED